jgi:hypothetical protein
VTDTVEITWQAAEKRRLLPRKTGEDACPTMQYHQLGTRVGQASWPVGGFTRALAPSWGRVWRRAALADSSLRLPPPPLPALPMHR